MHSTGEFLSTSLTFRLSTYLALGYELTLLVLFKKKNKNMKAKIQYNKSRIEAYEGENERDSDDIECKKDHKMI